MNAALFTFTWRNHLITLQAGANLESREIEHVVEKNKDIYASDPKALAAPQLFDQSMSFDKMISLSRSRPTAQSES